MSTSSRKSPSTSTASSTLQCILKHPRSSHAPKDCEPKKTAVKDRSKQVVLGGSTTKEYSPAAQPAPAEEEEEETEEEIDQLEDNDSIGQPRPFPPPFPLREKERKGKQKEVLDPPSPTIQPRPKRAASTLDDKEEQEDLTSSPPSSSSSHSPSPPPSLSETKLPSPPSPEIIDGETFYQVESILAMEKRGKEGKKWYLVKWAGYPVEEAT
ncbi:hypothetical protein JCM8547_007672 [Rhodosporidiobolus lusitaniae]